MGKEFIPKKGNRENLPEEIENGSVLFCKDTGEIFLDDDDQRFPMGTSKEANQKFANALKGKESGYTVVLRDVSPIEHNVKVKVKRKNLLKYPYDTTTTTINGIEWTDNGDGTINVMGETLQDDSRFILTTENPFENGKSYSWTSFSEDVHLVLSYFDETGSNYWVEGGIIWNDKYAFEHMFLLITPEISVDVVVQPIIVEGATIDSYWEPYISDLTQVKLQVLVPNAEPVEYIPNTDGIFDNIVSASPTMTLQTNSDGVIIEAEYNQDLDKIIKDLPPIIPEIYVGSDEEEFMNDNYILQIDPEATPMINADTLGNKSLEYFSSKDDLNATSTILNVRIDSNSTEIAEEKNLRIEAVANEKSERQAEIAVERARINTFTSLSEGSTTGDAELTDIRVGIDGYTYDTAGEAVRSQVGNIVQSIKYKENTISRNLINTEKYENINFNDFYVNNAKVNIPIPDSSVLEDGSRYVLVMIIDDSRDVIGNASWAIKKANGEALCGRTINNPVKEEEVPESYKDASYIEIYFNGTGINSYTGKIIQCIQLVKYTGHILDYKYSPFETEKIALIHNDVSESVCLKESVISLNKIDSYSVQNINIGNWKDKGSNIRTICDIIPNSFDATKKYTLYAQASNGTETIDISGRVAIYFVENGNVILEKGNSQVFSGADVSTADKAYLYISDAVQTELTGYYIDFVQVVESETQVTERILFKKGTIVENDIVIEEINKTIEDLKYGEQYNISYINSFCNRVQEDLKPTDGLFGFITDIQSDGSDYMLTHYKNIGKVSEYLPITHILDGGDFIMGYDEKLKTIELLRNYSRLVHKNNIPYLIAKGNHDDNSFYATNNGKLFDDLITDKEWYSFVTKYNERYSNVVVDRDNPTGGYCYIDDEASKIRTIIVNVCDIPYIKNDDGTAMYNAMQDYAIRQKQLEFIRDALMCSDKENPSEWGIIITMHFMSYSTVNAKCLIEMLMSKCGKAYTGEQIYITNVNDYNTKYDNSDFAAEVTYNFDSNRGDVICVLAGHTHTDNTEGTDGRGDNVISGAITQIITESSLPMPNEDGEDRTVGTVNEECFDIIRVDRTDKKIKCYRFGKGSDREFSYTTTV